MPWSLHDLGRVWDSFRVDWFRDNKGGQACRAHQKDVRRMRYFVRPWRLSRWSWAGTYTTSQSAAIRCSTSGATIYHTTDGSTPNTSSTKYVSPFPIFSSTTVKAYAVETGYADSSLGTAAYTISLHFRTYTWNNTRQNTDCYPDLTSVAYDGSRIYLGTNGAGVLVSANGGEFLDQFHPRQRPGRRLGQCRVCLRLHNLCVDRQRTFDIWKRGRLLDHLHHHQGFGKQRGAWGVYLRLCDLRQRGGRVVGVQKRGEFLDHLYPRQRLGGQLCVGCTSWVPRSTRPQMGGCLYPATGETPGATTPARHREPTAFTACVSWAPRSTRELMEGSWFPIAEENHGPPTPLTTA